MSSQLPTWLCRCLCPHGLVVTQLGTPWCPWDCTTGTLGYLSVACFFHCENQIIFSNSQASDASRGASIVAALGAAPGTCPQLGVQHLLSKARELPAPRGAWWPPRAPEHIPLLSAFRLLPLLQMWCGNEVPMGKQRAFFAFPTNHARS